MVKIIKNIDVVEHVYAGQVIPAGTQYTLQANDEINMSSSDALLLDIANGKAQINDGVSDISGIANQINYLKDNFQRVTVLTQPSQNTFTSKSIVVNGVTKNLFRRATGIKTSITIGTNTILFAIPYPWVKITGAQIIGGEIGDTINLMILDSTSGTYTGIPNYQLNQFGFDVNIAKDFFESRSQFDADLYAGMQIKMVYSSITNKTIGINFILDEVKS